LDKDEGHKEIYKPSKGLAHCWTTVLFQEIERYNQLLETMQKSLVLLKKAIRGIE